MKTNVLAIIPARSGSKGLINKNIKELNGKPLLAYTINAAIGANIFDEIFVSTDSEQYKNIAEDYGASIPFLRSIENSTDIASSWDVVRETIEQYKIIGKDFKTVCLLQPTTPLRNAEDILNSYEIYNNKNANAVVSVCEVDHSPLWCNTLPNDLSLCNFINNKISTTPRQSLDSYYRINGAIYFVNVNAFNKCQDIYSSNCYAYIMDKKRSIDIDDEYDFIVAEALLNKLVVS